ncbi:hypothetical protein SAMN04487993_101334 [Salipiger marinus]|uniref:Uncharacterized protein n=1 Tax=Salipiger marinus TaxID=555512 RepID=A0A1G8PPI4_9RHOB|nr:hypothetical protein SAMN04487993_101334 [Salipiger marinus]
MRGAIRCSFASTRHLRRVLCPDWESIRVAGRLTNTMASAPTPWPVACLSKKNPAPRDPSAAPLRRKRRVNTGGGRCTAPGQRFVPPEGDAAPRSTSTSCHRSGDAAPRAGPVLCATGAGRCTAPRQCFVPTGGGCCTGQTCAAPSLGDRDIAGIRLSLPGLGNSTPRWMQCHWDCQHPAQAAETCGMCVGPSRPRGIPSTRNTRTPSARVRLFEASSRVASLVLLTIAAFFWVT